MSKIQDNNALTTKYTTIIELFTIFYEKIAQKQSNHQAYSQNLNTFKQILYGNLGNSNIILNYLNQFTSVMSNNFPTNPEIPEKSLKSEEKQFSFDFNSNTNFSNNLLDYSPNTSSFINNQPAYNIHQNTDSTSNLKIKRASSLLKKEMNLNLAKVKFLNELIYSESHDNMLFFSNDSKTLKFDSNTSDIAKGKVKLTTNGKIDNYTLIKEIKVVQKWLSLPEIRSHPEFNRIKSNLDDYKETFKMLDSKDGFYCGCALSWIISLFHSPSSSLSPSPSPSQSHSHSPKNLIILINIFCAVYSRNIILLSAESNSETARDYFCDAFQDIIKKIQQNENNLIKDFCAHIINSPFFEKCLLSFFKEALLHVPQDSENNSRSSKINRSYDKNDIDLGDLENIAILLQMDISLLTIDHKAINERYIKCKDLFYDNNVGRTPKILEIIYFKDMNFPLASGSGYMFFFKEDKSIKKITNVDDIILTETSFETRNKNIILSNGERVPSLTYDLSLNIGKNKSIQSKAKHNISPLHSSFKNRDNVSTSIQDFGGMNSQGGSDSNRIFELSHNQIEASTPKNKGNASFVNRRSDVNISEGSVSDSMSFKKTTDFIILSKTKHSTPVKHFQKRNNSSVSKKIERTRNNKVEEIPNPVNKGNANANANANANVNANANNTNSDIYEDDNNKISARNNSNASNKPSQNNALKSIKQVSTLNSIRSSIDEQKALKARFSNEGPKIFEKLPISLKNRVNEINSLLEIDSNEIEETLKKYINAEIPTVKSNNLIAYYNQICKANLQKKDSILEYQDHKLNQQFSSTSVSQKNSIPSLTENYSYSYTPSNIDYLTALGANVYERQSFKSDEKSAINSFIQPSLGIMSTRPDISSTGNMIHHSPTKSNGAVDQLNINKNTTEYIGTMDSLGYNSFSYPQFITKSSSTKDYFDHYDHSGNGFTNTNSVKKDDIKYESYNNNVFNNFMTCIKCQREFVRTENYDKYSITCYLCR